MRAYGDTSWWIAWSVSQDVTNSTAVTISDRLDEVEVVWTPWQRLEVFNALRQLDRRGFMTVQNASQIIRSLENDVRIGYWPHVEFSWTGAVRRANEISIQFSPTLSVRGMDLFHVAIALELEADLLLTFDTDQAALAQAVGINVHQWA